MYIFILQQYKTTRSTRIILYVSTLERKQFVVLQLKGGPPLKIFIFQSYKRVPTTQIGSFLAFLENRFQVRLEFYASNSERKRFVPIGRFLRMMNQIFHRQVKRLQLSLLPKVVLNNFMQHICKIILQTMVKLSICRFLIDINQFWALQPYLQNRQQKQKSCHLEPLEECNLLKFNKIYRFTSNYHEKSQLEVDPPQMIDRNRFEIN